MFRRYLYLAYSRYAGNSRWVKRRFTLIGFLVVTAIVALGLLGVDTNYALSYQGAMLLLVLLVAAMIWSSFGRVPLELERELPRFGSAATALTYRIVVHNHTARVQDGVTLFENLADPRPSFEEFANTPEPGEEKRNKFDRTFIYYRWTWLLERNIGASIPPVTVPATRPGETTEVEVTIMPRRRGVMRFESVTVGQADPFGLFRTLRRVDLPQSLLILPKRYPVPPIALAGAMKYHEGGVTMASAVGESEEFVALRDYRPGDPLRHIHWKSWARTGRPIVKEFQDEFFSRHAMILDTFASGAREDVFEEAVSVAASFACTLETQESLLDLLFVGSQAYCFTMGRGLAQADQMLEILAAVKVCYGKPFSDLERLVSDHIGQVSDCICIFVAWDEARRDLVRQLGVLGVPLLVIVIVGPGEAEAMRARAGADAPEHFHVLEADRVAEGLAQL